MLRAHSRAFVKPTLQYSRWQLSRLISSERSSSAGVPGVMAIRREDNSVWERRAPLAPKHVRKLVRSGVKVLVQPSNRRAYPMKSYSDIGAVIQEDISEASVVVGVKQVPIDLLLPDRTYVFFSHTIKAQESNMSMLDAVLEKNIRLIDYEKMCDESGQRTVAFGKYAGVAGMINILHGLGLRLLALGHHTPFMFIGPSHNYRNSSMAKQAIRDAGYEISLDMMPKSIGPLTFVFTGSGNVSQGAQEVFQELPHEYVEPKHLHKVAKHGSTNKLYVCVVRREDHLVHKEGKRFCPDEYDSHPERYVSTFSNKIAPHASVIINGIYWAPNSPRLISIPDAKNLLQPQSSPWLPQSEGCPHLPHKLLAICDISADPGGSMEFVRECTNIDSPFCLYDADDHMETESFKGNGVLVCSIDNMPTQIPRESTDFFGGLLLPYVSDMLKSDATSSFDEFDVSPVVKNAVIASNGKLTPNFEYINNLRRTSRSKHKAMKAVHEAEKRVLVLGSGFVAGPVIEYLTRDDKYHVTLVSDLKESADALANKFRNVEPMLLDTQRNKDEVEGLIKQHDLVISLLPYSLHAEICALCIKHTCNMVTASYCTPDMMRLHKHAIEAGITVVNEVGVDPGIDHMLAMECFDIARDAGGKVKSFVSYCGGLPAPEFSDNPLRYKFNWSPRGVLMNCLSGARYLKDGEVIDVPGEGHLLNVIEPKTFLPGFHLEGYPNRDSTIYGKLYDIESAHTIIRGTLRYRGFAEAAQALLDIGLLSLKAHPLLHPAGPDITWKDYLCNTFGTSMDILPDSLRELVFDRVDQEDIRMNCIEKLGLFEDTLIDKRHTPLDTLSNYLTKRLSYNAGERDLLIMRHEIDVEYPDGSLDREDINFVVYGDPNSYSAMAKTVGFPTGIAAKMVLEGEIQQKGMVLPLTRDIYRPILKRLKQEGIVANESKVMSNEAVPRVQAIV